MRDINIYIIVYYYYYFFLLLVNPQQLRPLGGFLTVVEGTLR